jgi:trimethylamine:corrinoid methyltransferase-like protein
MTTERRAGVLTEHDFERIGEEFAKQLETIGYDVSTPESRAAIVKDHAYVRSWRLGIEKTKLAGWILVFSAAFVWLVRAMWSGVLDGLRTLK